MREKRKEKRREEENKVKVLLPSDLSDDSGESVLLTLTRDISMGGLKIVTEKKIPVGTVLELDLTLSKPPKQVKAKGKVRWTKPIFNGEVNEVGIEIIDMNQKSILALMEHLYKKE